MRLLFRILLAVTLIEPRGSFLDFIDRELIPLGPPGITWNGSCDAANYTRGEALVDATPWETVLALGVEASNPTTYCQTDYGFQEYIQDPAAPSPTAASQAPTSTVAPETRHWTTAPTSC